MIHKTIHSILLQLQTENSKKTRSEVVDLWLALVNLKIQQLDYGEKYSPYTDSLRNSKVNFIKGSEDHSMPVTIVSSPKSSTPGMLFLL